MAVGRIGNSLLKTIVAGKKDQFIWDEEIPGFGLKVTPAGAKSYVFSYRMGGREAPKRRHTIGTHGHWTPASARDEARRLRILVDRGVDPRSDDVKRRREQVDLAFASYAESFIEGYLKVKWIGGHSIAAGYLRREAIPYFKDRPINQISSAEIAALLSTMRDRPASRRNTFAVLRRMFRWAISQGSLADTPMRYMEVPPGPASRERVLSDSELALVWRSSDEIGYPFGPLVKLLLLTGQRREEVAALSWNELDREKEIWTLPSSRAKNNVTHDVPLSPQALEVIDEVNALQRPEECQAASVGRSWPTNGWVFTSTGSKPVTGYSVAKTRLDKAIAKILAASASVTDDEPEPMEPWRFHDLRRTLATGFQRQGARFEVTEAILNHVGISRKGVAGTYQRHAWADEKRAEIQKWGAHIGVLLRSSNE